MKTLHLFAAFALLSILGACAQLGLEAPQTFNGRAAQAQITVTGLRSAALELSRANAISVADLKNVQATADAGNEAIDLAKAMRTSDPTGASTKLDSAISILTAARSYLAAKKGTP